MVAGDRLAQYSRCFNFVEVNVTHYMHPPLILARGWRRRVQNNFAFSVKCHRNVSHKYLLNPSVKSLEDFNRSLAICHALHAEILVVQTPPSLGLSAALIRSFIKSVDLGGVRLALEPRGSIAQDALRAMERHEVIHVVDLSRDMPAYVGDILYTRLLGLGDHNIYQFDDYELRDIRVRVESTGVEKAFLSFHGLKMYVDAGRMKEYIETGVPPPVTNGVGLDSLRYVVAEDAVFPATRDELFSAVGWKLVEMPGGVRVRAITILSSIEDRLYKDLDDLMNSVRIAWPESH